MSRAIQPIKDVNRISLRKKLKNKSYEQLMKNENEIITWVREVFTFPELTVEELYGNNYLFLLQLMNFVCPTEKIKFELVDFLEVQRRENLKELYETLRDDVGYRCAELLSLLNLNKIDTLEDEKKKTKINKKIKKF